MLCQLEFNSFQIFVPKIKKEGHGGSKSKRGWGDEIEKHTIYPTALSSWTFIYPSNCPLLLLLRIPKSHNLQKMAKKKNYQTNT